MKKKKKMFKKDESDSRSNPTVLKSEYIISKNSSSVYDLKTYVR